jgi:phage protein D
VHTRSYEEKTGSEIIKGLIEGYALQAEVEDFGGVLAFSAQAYKSDYEYLMGYANAYGKQVFADGKTIYVGGEISVRTDEIIYERGKNLIRFKGARNILGAVSDIDIIGWDHLKNESFVGHASLSDIPLKVGGGQDWAGVSKGGSGTYKRSQINHDVKDRDDAKQLALGMLQTNTYSFSSGEGSGEGNNKLRAGMRVTIKMAGKDSDGEYLAEEVIHHYDYREGYITGFSLKRNMIP